MFNLDPGVLFFSIFFSVAGLAYYSYGKEKGLYFKLAGVMLLVVTFFINNLWALIGLGVTFMVLPFLLERL